MNVTCSTVRSPGVSVFTATVHFKNMCSLSSVTLNESSDSRMRKPPAALMLNRLRYTDFAPSQHNLLRSFFIKLTFSSRFSKGLSSEVCKQVLVFCPTFFYRYITVVISQKLQARAMTELPCIFHNTLSKFSGC